MALQHTDYKIVSTGIDWLTFTMKPNNPAIPEVKALFDVEMDKLHEQGFESTTCGIKGYSGPGCGAYGYGDRAADTLFRVSGDAADKIAYWLLKKGFDFNPSRVDLQVTLQFAYDPKDFAANMRAQIRLHESCNDAETSTRINLIEGGAQGNSIDINSRRSRSYLRNYDKSREQKGKIAKNCIRFEQENKRERARAVFAYFRAEKSSKALAVSQVSTALKRVGAIMDWNMAIPRQNIKTERHVTTNEKRTKWLIEQVAPIVRKMPDDANKARIAHAMGFDFGTQEPMPPTKPTPALLTRILNTKVR
jgi:hypothetical protein